MRAEIVALLVIVLGFAVYYDLRYRKIPNLITFPGMLAALALHGMVGGLEGVLFSLKGLGLGMGVLFIPFLLGALGAGDAKLMGAIGAALGPSSTVSVLVLSALAGGIYAFGIIIFRRGTVGQLVRRWRRAAGIPSREQSHGDGSDAESGSPPVLRYGLPIAAGTVVLVILKITGTQSIF